jgi:hypothetical protein
MSAEKKRASNNPDGRPTLPEGKGKRSHLHLRIERERKAAYVKAAQPGTLADWCIKNLDAASGYCWRD